MAAPTSIGNARNFHGGVAYKGGSIGSTDSVWGAAANKERTTATQQTVQQVIDYLKAHPDEAKKAADFARVEQFPEAQTE